MRKDLNMRKGKMVSQGAHAAVANIMQAGTIDENDVFTIDLKEHKELKAWLQSNYKKICLGADSELELVALFEKAKEMGLNCSLITDSGLTEFNGVATITCCAIGPNEDSSIDNITKGLKLL